MSKLGLAERGLFDPLDRGPGSRQQVFARLAGAGLHGSQPLITATGRSLATFLAMPALATT
ncbi:MAG: hypothetical protein ACC647_02545, partial [Anaerolineales bacterium]